MTALVERSYASADDLTRFILDEILIALKQPPRGLARRLLGPLLKLPARRFAVLMAEVDRGARAKQTLIAHHLTPQSDR